MKAIKQLFKDYGMDCDLDVNNHLLFYNSDDDIIHIEHSGELVIEEYFEGTLVGSNGETKVMDGRETISTLFQNDYSLCLEFIIEAEKNEK
jgi:hypothetical protein